MTDLASPEAARMRAEFFAWVEEQGCDTDGAWSAWQAAWDRPRWQPIETAPKDDRASAILAVVKGRVRLVQWGKTSHVPLYGWCLADQGVEDFDLCEPTHWMPFPAAPEAP